MDKTDRQKCQQRAKWNDVSDSTLQEIQKKRQEKAQYSFAKSILNNISTLLSTIRNI